MMIILLPHHEAFILVMVLSVFQEESRIEPLDDLSHHHEINECTMNVCDFGLAASWRNRLERMDDSSVFRVII